MLRNETCRREYKRLATLLVLGAVLAACTPEGQVQETKPAASQTIVATNTPEHTTTPENTPTPEATSTPEATATPEAIEIPTNLTEFGSFEISPLPLSITEWGSYKTRLIRAIKIRPEDIHNEKFTLLNGRYLVNGWFDAWWQDEAEGDSPGKTHHLAVPFMVIDTERKLIWFIDTPFLNDASTPNMQNIYEAIFRWDTEAFTQELSFTPGGDLVDRQNFRLIFGSMPNQDMMNSTNSDFLYIKQFIDFWQPLLENIYTEEKIEEFAQTGDASILSLETLSDELPYNFVIPIR